jgi:chitin disaccharide deacetylase
MAYWRQARQTERAMTRQVTLCADDYGLSRGIDAAIDALARRGRLNALSCLTNAPAWPIDGPQWATSLPGVAVGLHLNLTEGHPLSAALRERWPALPSVQTCIVAAHLGRLPLSAVSDELAAQWDAFVAVTGRAPDFVDGHQHVHHLPGVRNLVLDWVRRQPRPPALRSTGRVIGPGSPVKRLAIEWTGGRALARALARQTAVAHNRALLGVYDFVDPDYRRLMRSWLARVPAEGSLIFCHPGQRSPDAAGDAIAAAREREWAYLGSDEFAADLQAAAVTLSAPDT